METSITDLMHDTNTCEQIKIIIDNEMCMVNWVVGKLLLDIMVHLQPLKHYIFAEF